MNILWIFTRIYIKTLDIYSAIIAIYIALAKRIKLKLCKLKLCNSLDAAANLIACAIFNFVFFVTFRILRVQAKLIFFYYIVSNQKNVYDVDDEKINKFHNFDETKNK